MKRGKTPSLIGGGAGASKFVEAAGKRKCKRCDGEIPAGTPCIEVGIPGSMGYKGYCCQCYRDILKQTDLELSKLSQKLDEHEE